MIAAGHPFAVRSLNALDENGLEGCATCGRPRWAHPEDRAAEGVRAAIPDGAWRAMVALGQEIQGADCWSWWESGEHEGHHRCALRDGHMGLHECCCGAQTPYGNRATVHRHQPGAPCTDNCPAGVLARKAGS